jgi:opacity protein-like surface antigen
VIRTRLYAGLLAAVVAVPAQAQLIGVGVGTLVPQGDLADGAKSGLAAAANIEFGGRLKFRGEFFWANSDLKGVIITDPDGVPLPNDANVSGDIKFLAGTASAVFYPLAGMFQPYVLGGVGMYQRKVAQDIEDVGDEIDDLRLKDSDFGFHFGGGLKLQFKPIAVFGEIRYHRVKHEGEDNKSNFVPILIGVRLF